MALIRPFQAVRPNVKYAEDVAALPYDVMSAEEARQISAENPYSFLHVDKAEIDLDPAVNPYSPVVYEKAKENLDRMLHDGILIKDESPMLYIYQLTMNGRIQTGLVFCASIDEYLNNTIKKHEFTREDKEQDRICHVDVCDANTGPVFLTYKDKQNINDSINLWKQNHEPVYDFVSDDKIRHTVWTIDDPNIITALVNNFKGVPSFYIADGHHRNASAVKVGLRRRERYPFYSGEEEFNFYLAVAFPASQLHILDYNRVVKDLNGLDWQTFLQKTGEKFDVSAPYGKPIKPKEPKSFVMYGNGKWYALTCGKECLKNLSAVDHLDVSILQNTLLSPILGINDPRTDNRINFIGGIRGLEELKKLVDSKEYAVAFAMHPTSIQEVIAIADENNVMPPKSTWFEPKLRSGLFIHKLS